MTKEEREDAINFFNEVAKREVDNAKYSRLAIEALEQQPCEDCVSREAVNDLVDELARAISDERMCISRGRSTATIMRDILHLPSVTPKEKTGHWVFKNDNIAIPTGYYQCSECEEGKLLNEDNFCPNCGAKMVS